MTITAIRESPPTRLSIVTKTAAGTIGRWAADERNPESQAADIQFSTAMPGGFDTFSCSLARDPKRSYFDVEELADIKVYGPGGQIAWEGQLQQLPDQGGSSSALNPAGVGYQDLLNDDSGAAMIYIDQDLSNWTDPSLARQQALTTANYQIGSVSTATDPETGLPALVLEVDGPWPALVVAEARYDAGLAGTVKKIYYAYAPGPGTGSMTNVVAVAATAGGGAASSSSIGVAATSGAFTATTPQRYGLLQEAYGSPGSTSGFAYLAYWRVAVIGNHNIPIQGTWPPTWNATTKTLTGGIGVLASDVAADALSRWVPNLTYTTGANGTIQPSSFIIPQMAFKDPGPVATIIQQITGYELLDWAVWEGPTYYQNARGQSAKTRNWVSRVKPAQLQNAGPSVARIWNGVIVSYTGVDGGTYTVGPPGSGCTTESPLLVDTDPQNPANAAGPNGQPRKRWTLLTAGTSTANTAIQIGQVYLAQSKELNQSGQAAIVGTVQDDHGVWWPSWMVRAGDTIRFADARDPSPRRIVSSDYSHQSRTNTLQLDAPPDTETALLQRLSVSIAPLGLS